MSLFFVEIALLSVFKIHVQVDLVDWSLMHSLFFHWLLLQFQLSLALNVLLYFVTAKLRAHLVVTSFSNLLVAINICHKCHLAILGILQVAHF